MHSVAMDRLREKTTVANVGIGDAFPVRNLGLSELKKKPDKCLCKHGHISLTRMNRLLQLYRKIKAGRIPPDVVANVMRDHKKDFEKFDRLGLAQT